VHASTCLFILSASIHSLNNRNIIVHSSTTNVTVYSTKTGDNYTHTTDTLQFLSVNIVH